MELKKPVIELIAITPDAQELIEQAGRTCYLSFERMTDSTASSFIRNTLKREHLSILEHASASFRISGVSRAFTHQLVRHRIASFSQQSQRYVNEDNFDYILPPSIEENPEALQLYREYMDHTKDLYAQLRKMSILKEDARFILPNAINTEIVFSANFRELRHFFELRTEKHAQWEIRRAAVIMLKIMKEKAPDVFADFVINESDWTTVTDKSLL
jgi:thymidylate synthase (FAD)